MQLRATIMFLLETGWNLRWHRIIEMTMYLPRNITCHVPRNKTRWMAQQRIYYVNDNYLERACRSALPIWQTRDDMFTRRRRCWIISFSSLTTLFLQYFTNASRKSILNERNEKFIRVYRHTVGCKIESVTKIFEKNIFHC